MRHCIIFILIFSCNIFSFCQAQEQVSVKNKNNIIRKDSIGNFLTHKQALDLLRTGKYISVPTMNSLMEVEIVIRKPRKEDNGKYQSFTDGNIVLTGSGLQNRIPTFNLGDTIPPIKIVDKHGKRLVVTNDSILTRNTLLVFIKENNTTWRYDIKPFIKLLSNTYPKVNFVICPGSTNRYNLTSYFTSRELKQVNNLFIAESEFIEDMSIESFTTHFLVDSIGKVKLWIPPLPNGAASNLLIKYFSVLEKEE